MPSVSKEDIAEPATESRGEICVERPERQQRRLLRARRRPPPQLDDALEHLTLVLLFKVFESASKPFAMVTCRVRRISPSVHSCSSGISTRGPPEVSRPRTTRTPRRHVICLSCTCSAAIRIKSSPNSSNEALLQPQPRRRIPTSDPSAACTIASPQAERAPLRPRDAHWAVSRRSTILKSSRGTTRSETFSGKSASSRRRSLRHPRRRPRRRRPRPPSRPAAVSFGGKTASRPTSDRLRPAAAAVPGRRSGGE